MGMIANMAGNPGKASVQISVCMTSYRETCIQGDEMLAKEQRPEEQHLKA